MGAMSFGISEIIKSPQEGWFKFLTADEGAFYNVPLPPEGEELVDQFKKMRKPSQRVDIDRKISMIRQNTEDQDKIGLNDFNFLRVLGRGSFGKVMLAELKGNLFQDMETPMLSNKTKDWALVHERELFMGGSHIMFAVPPARGT